MNAISSNTDWQRDETDTKRATYHKARYAQRAGYVAQYEGSDSYNWQDIRYGHRLYRERVFLLNIQVITTRGKTKQGGCHAAQYHYQIKYLFHFSYGFSHYKIYLMPKPYWVWKCFAALLQRTRSRRRSNRTTLSER
mgnify:CR=1 FL=1